MKATKTGARSRMNIPAEKRPESKAVSYACILVIFFAIISVLILKVVQTSALGGILGNDFRFHYALAQEYNQGKNALFSDTAITVNGGPYPPLYHMIMVVMMQFGILEQFSILLQTIGFPLVIAIMAYLAYRQMGLRTAAMTSAILLSSVAMFDRSQAIPQMLDMIFFPLAIYFLMKERKWPYIACMLIPIYAHGMWALLFFGGMTLYTLFRRKYISYNVWVLALSLPIIIMTAWYLPGYLGVHGGAPQSDQEVYASEPSFFMDYLGFAIAIVAIAFIVYLVVKSARQKRFAYRFTELEILCLFWLLAMMPLMFTIIDRFCSYAAPPLALLGAGFLTRVTIKKPKAFIWSVAGIAVFSFAYQALLLWAFLLEGKHIFISNILKDYGIIPA